MHGLIHWGYLVCFVMGLCGNVSHVVTTNEKKQYYPLYSHTGTVKLISQVRRVILGRKRRLLNRTMLISQVVWCEEVVECHGIEVFCVFTRGVAVLRVRLLFFGGDVTCALLTAGSSVMKSWVGIGEFFRRRGRRFRIRRVCSAASAPPPFHRRPRPRRSANSKNPKFANSINISLRSELKINSMTLVWYLLQPLKFTALKSVVFTTLLSDQFFQSINQSIGFFTSRTRKCTNFNTVHAPICGRSRESVQLSQSYGRDRLPESGQFYFVAISCAADSGHWLFFSLLFLFWNAKQFYSTEEWNIYRA